MKTIVVKLKSAGNKSKVFQIKDNLNTVLGVDITKEQLISGYAVEVDNSVTVIKITDNINNILNIPITSLYNSEYATLKYTDKNTSSFWTHLTTIDLFNSFYGKTEPYILEYPFNYNYKDEIVQSVQDYTKAFKYFNTKEGYYNYNKKIQTNNEYFNKVILYNDQQSSGLLYLVAKPIRNLAAYNTYPIYGSNNKTITYTKTDNFYKINTFWNVVKDTNQPLFLNSCESMSIDKVINNDNMVYTNTAYKKAPLRAKDLKIRYVLDDSSSIHLVSQFITSDSQISYK